LVKKVIVPLTGGLGNQLFQIAAGLRSGSEVVIDCTLGRPRVNSVGEPEIFSFDLPENIKVAKARKASNFETKVFGYLLRMGLEKRGIEKIWGFPFLARVSGSLILSARYKRFVFTKVNSGVGFDANWKKFGNCQIGYFQTYRTFDIEEVREVMMEISPAEGNANLEKYREMARNVMPLVVHYRLGDYKTEQHFGIPAPQYYSNAIKMMWDTGKYDSIWVFSDEINDVKAIFPAEFHKYAEWVEGFEDSPAASLEAMRLGHGYVIANSTYSWWGARMSHIENPIVVAPEPWFKSAEEPNELIPHNWSRIRAWP